MSPTLDMTDGMIDARCLLNKNENEDKRQIAVFNGKPKAKARRPFALVFYKDMLTLIVDHGLTKNDLQVILALLDFVGKGNLLKLTQKDLAKASGVGRNNLNRSLKRLKEAGIIGVSENGSEFLNPLLMTKENLYEMRESEAYGQASKGKAKDDLAY